MAKQTLAAGPLPNDVKRARDREDPAIITNAPEGLRDASSTLHLIAATVVEAAKRPYAEYVASLGPQPHPSFLGIPRELRDRIYNSLDEPIIIRCQVKLVNK